jgi:hypothetical protein
MLNAVADSVNAVSKLTPTHYTHTNTASSHMHTDSQSFYRYTESNYGGNKASDLGIYLVLSQVTSTMRS